MALFESYERREKQILAVINQYGINTIEECADVCKAKGLDIYTKVTVVDGGVPFLRISATCGRKSSRLYRSA